MRENDLLKKLKELAREDGFLPRRRILIEQTESEMDEKKLKNRRKIYEILQRDLDKRINQLELTLTKSKVIASRIADDKLEEELEKIQEILDKLKDRNDKLKDALEEYLNHNSQAVYER